jgi:glycine oxidase
MRGTVAIVGAGILGRVLAFWLIQQRWHVSIFDRSDSGASNSCSYAAAGMLCPISELVEGNLLVYQLGVDSLNLWDQILGRGESDVYYRREGGLLVFRAQDYNDWLRTYHILRPQIGLSEMRLVEKTEIVSLEPELDPRFLRGIYFPTEGQIDNRGVLRTLLRMTESRGANFYFQQNVTKLVPHQITTNGENKSFDWVVDCRGWPAKEDGKALRGVRGEMIEVIAPDVNFHRPIRLMHPNHPVYVVPRPKNKYLIGATCLETEDFGPITVQSVLELLSAAFMLHSGFAEARMIETRVQCRPAFIDNKPRVEMADGLIAINGLYRNGFLVSPAIAHAVAAAMNGQKTYYQELFREE